MMTNGTKQKVEPLFVKFLFKSNLVNPVECKSPSRDFRADIKFDKDRFYEYRIPAGLLHGLWEGCELEVRFDDSIEDIILLDKHNTTFLSMKENFNNDIRNPTYILDQHICAKKTDGII